MPDFASLSAPELLIAVGLLWMTFKALLTVLVLLGASRLLRRTPLAPLVIRLEHHLAAPRARLARLLAAWRGARPPTG